MTCLCAKHLQDSEKTRIKGRSWKMRAARQTTHSQLSWARLSGTRPCPTMATTSSWSTWTWRSSCRRTASPPTQPRVTRTGRQHSRRSRPRHLPRLPRPHLPWWTSAAAPPPRFTRPWRLRTASTAPAQQVGIARAAKPDVLLKVHLHVGSHLFCRKGEC